MGSGEPEISILYFSKYKFLCGNFLSQHKFQPLLPVFSAIGLKLMPLVTVFTHFLLFPVPLAFLPTHFAVHKGSGESFNLISYSDFLYFNEKKNVATLIMKLLAKISGNGTVILLVLRRKIRPVLT